VADTVRVKKRCCKDSPRCKRCPVVWKRLARAGLAKRKSNRLYDPAPELKKRHIKATRHY
jgi:hypothetical protein